MRRSNVRGKEYDHRKLFGCILGEMKALNPTDNEVCRCLGCQQGCKVIVKTVIGENLIGTMNCRVMPQKSLKELDKSLKVN